MSDAPNDPAKKLIIDEDWKSQVEAEREAALHPAEAAQPAEPSPASSARGPLPPADFSFLVGSLYLQGVIALGLMANPMTNKSDVQLDQAKHVIDMLTMLQQKSEGNRTPEESGDLEGALHELRLTYLTVSEGQTPKP